ncbi:MAG: amidase family protein, partial [Actinomycetota bacterium]|nr:amidase family protein [Actinomycetota bacterium]
AWLDDDFCEVDAEVLAVLDAVVARMEADGMSVDRSARPDLDAARAAKLGGMLVSSATSRPGDTDGPSHREWCDWDVEREELRTAWASFFGNFDAVVMPVGFVPPFPHIHEGDFASRTLECNGQKRPYLDVIAWTLLTGMAYLPSSVPPVGLTPGGLPVGMQVVGPYGSDLSTIALAGHIASLGDGFVAPPIAR